MKTIEVMYTPDQVIQYKSKEFGMAEMKIEEVKVTWLRHCGEDILIIKYGGQPKYLNRPGNGRRRYGSSKVWVSDLKNIKLKETI